jgi:phosphoglycerate dehydrogenase-like enzyme
MEAEIILDPHPRTIDLLFHEKDLSALNHLATINGWQNGRMPAEELERHLPSASILIGQTDLPRDRLERAKRLKAIINVEGNFLPNIDYEYCFERGIQLLSTGGAYSETVAEMLVGFAICLARGIVGADRLFRAGKEIYGRQSNQSSFLLYGKPVGIIGFGSLGRGLLKLLKPFECRVLVHDPWLPDNVLLEHGVVPVPLQELMRSSKIVFLLAGATRENPAMIGKEEIGLLEKGSIFILASRASLVDFQALTERLERGDLLAAIDVFPQEPFPADHPVRALDNVLLSAHRAGSLAETYNLMGQMIVDDVRLILNGLPPVRLQKAQRETVSRMSSRPVTG